MHGAFLRLLREENSLVVAGMQWKMLHNFIFNGLWSMPARTT
jgi:hypothetical protein